MKIKPFKTPTLALLFALAFSTSANAQQGNLLDKVNLYMGTADDFGQMTPGATVPYGQIQVCPDSKPRQHPGYDFEVPAISGFSINRLSGVGGSGCGGNVSLMPDATGQDVRLIKHTEVAKPVETTTRTSTYRAESSGKVRRLRPSAIVSSTKGELV